MTSETKSKIGSLSLDQEHRAEKKLPAILLGAHRWNVLERNMETKH